MEINLSLIYKRNIWFHLQWSMYKTYFADCFYIFFYCCYCYFFLLVLFVSIVNLIVTIIKLSIDCSSFFLRAIVAKKKILIKKYLLLIFFSAFFQLFFFEFSKNKFIFVFQNQYCNKNIIFYNKMMWDNKQVLRRK